MKITVLWDVAPCGMVEVYRHHRGACYFHHQGVDERGSKHLSNINKLLPYYMAQHPRRQ
jgi:hypothetical protein